MKLHEPIASTSPCMPFLPCTTCAFHRRTPVAGGAIHLCTLPPECALLSLGDDDDHEHDQEERLSAYLGTSCDVMRRMGALCGPHAHLWRAVDGR